jgi:allophanate hydrolase subunit 2
LGGYAKVGHVIDADLDRLGQLRPSDKVSLQCVEMAQALAANQARLGELACRCQAALAGLKAP